MVYYPIQTATIKAKRNWKKTNIKRNVFGFSVSNWQLTRWDDNSGVCTKYQRWLDAIDEVKEYIKDVTKTYDDLIQQTQGMSLIKEKWERRTMYGLDIDALKAKVVFLKKFLLFTAL